MTATAPSGCSAGCPTSNACKPSAWMTHSCYAASQLTLVGCVKQLHALVCRVASTELKHWSMVVPDGAKSCCLPDKPTLLGQPSHEYSTRHVAPERSVKSGQVRLHPSASGPGRRRYRWSPPSLYRPKHRRLPRGKHSYKKLGPTGHNLCHEPCPAGVVAPMQHASSA